MTIYVDEAALTIEFTTNLVNLSLVSSYDFVITSQYSHQPITLVADVIESNARYTRFETTFPTEFGNEHKNGVYYWEISQDGISLEKGLVKIITEPGGGLGTTNFDSGINTEDRVSEVFYRPNY